jgi:hypothetical protein
MFTGIFPMMAYKEYDFKYINDTAQYQLTLINDDLRQIIKYTAYDLQISSVEFYKNNKKILLMKFTKIKISNGIKYAKKIYFEDFSTKSKLKLIITDIVYNRDIDNSIYNPIVWKYASEELE